MKKIISVKENELKSVKNGEWILISTELYQWYGYNAENYVVLINAAGKFVIAKKYVNCVSLGSGIVSEFETFEEAIKNAEKIIEVI